MKPYCLRLPGHPQGSSHCSAKCRESKTDPKTYALLVALVETENAGISKLRI